VTRSYSLTDLVRYRQGMETNSQPAAFEGIPLVLDEEEESTVAIRNETIEEIGLEEQRQRHLRAEAARQQEEALRKEINERFP
jgi:hypothetical protein